MISDRENTPQKTTNMGVGATKGDGRRASGSIPATPPSKKNRATTKIGLGAPIYIHARVSEYRLPTHPVGLGIEHKPKVSG